ncbi:autotransporter outer membrane beta-barrel domain-containing protein [Parasutterella secunda]|uniref:autotransporter outer membrane beta-barrel domain-containing protein n=1 Tax=Parasutterella secunda TaxID=626947 RepID=UPI0025A4792D|nr:autotransporter outer membrane beta-barrel domain-containing protein [Parasutterella secunda]MDM8227272.1 autotransporter outer membrane beta-barrel domain-containing protein [Parasutterella secunda]
MIDSEIKGADQFTSSSLEIRGNSSVTANAVIIQNDLNVINTEGDTDTSLSTSSLSVGKITANDNFSITMNNSGIAEIGEVFAKNGTLQLNGSVETNKLTVAESATMSTGSLSFVGLNTAKPSANKMTVEGTLDADNVTVEYGRVRLLSNTSDIGEIILNNGASLIAGDGSEGLRLNTVTMNSKTGSAYDFFQAYQDISIDTLNMNGISRLEGYSTTDNDVQINVSSLNVANGATAQFVNSTGNSDASVNVTDAKVSDGGIIANTNLGNPDKQTYQNLSFANLNSTNATIQNGAGGQISIGEMSGTNSVIQVADTKANQISITTNKSSNLTVTSLDSSYGNKMTSVDQGVADLAETTVLGEDSTEGMKVVIGANDMTGRIEAVYDAKGNKISQSEEVNETNRTLTAVANLPVVAWRAELNDLYKRMGDLRATPYKSGAWVRYNGGKLKWSDGDLENDFHMIQVGIDTMPTENNIRFGTAFSYTKGDADFDGGSADLDTYSLSLYGTWLGDKGQYVDVIGRVASIKNDANARSLTGQGKAYDGKMDNTGLSLSAEAGWRFALPYNLFIEPQVEATYSYIDSDSFRYGDRKYELQSTDSFIARAGFMAGIQCPDNKGNVYVRASVVHDFLGETDVKVSNAHMSRTVSNDFGGTWGEFGIGANVSVSDNTYVYADVEHTTGGEIEEPWRVNFGVRYNF